MTTSRRIQLLWDNFVQAEPSSYEKSSWLDIFLAELLYQVKDGHTVNEILSFSVVGGVSTLIGCELLSDVYQLTAPGDEDLTPLCKYFLCGRGWRCLAALQCLGVQNLSCGCELANLLISLYPVGLSCSYGSNSRSHNEYIPCKPTKNIEEIFCIKTPLRHKFRPQSVRADFHRSISNNSASRSRRGRTPGSFTGDIVTSESEHMGDDADIIPTKASTLKIRLDPMDFDYFTSVIRSDDELRLDSQNYIPRKRERDKKLEKLPCPEDYKDNQIKEVLNSEICHYEFLQLVIQLLQSLCSADLSISSDNGQQIAVQAINFALQKLCSLQFGSAPTDSFTFLEVAELKSTMMQLLLTALEKVLTHPDIIMSIIRNGLLPVMLQVLEDAICKISTMTKAAEECDSALSLHDDFAASNITSSNCQKTISPEEACKVQELIFGTTYGIITFVYCLLLQRCTVDKFRDFMELFQLFIDSHNGRLIEKTVSVLLTIPYADSKLSVSRAKKVIDLVGQLIAILKKVRSELIHSHQCRKIRHKHCFGSSLVPTHHHHDLLGTVYATSFVGSNPNHPCCIGALFAMLMRLLSSTNPNIIIHVLKVMSICGTCCCFPPRSILSALTEVLKKHSNCRSAVFTLLERTLYTELGATVASNNKTTCSICCKNNAANNSILKLISASEYTFDDVGYDSSLNRQQQREMSDRTSSKNDSEKTLIEISINRNSWGCVDLFQDLFLSSDVKLCHAIASHLLKISPRCTPYLKYELLVKVFYPSFCKAKFLYLSNHDDVSKFSVLACLSVFSSLLGNIQLAEQFINDGGLKHIHNLISLPSFSKLCCAVLEITSIIEIWKLECQSTKLSDGNDDNFLDIQNLPSLCMLQKAIEGSTKQLLRYLERFLQQTADSESKNNKNENKLNRFSSEENVHLLVRSETIESRVCSPLSRDSSQEDESKYYSELAFYESDISTSYSEIQDASVPPVSKDLTSGVFSSDDETESKFLGREELEWDSYTQLLATVCVFWRSCANLTVYCPQYRKHLTSEPLLQDGQQLFVHLCNSVLQGFVFAANFKEENPTRSETYLHMKLIEATLIACLTTAKNLPEMLGQIHELIMKQESTELVNIQQLCDVLLKCAATEYCSEQVLPPYRKPKLPTLLVAGLWDEDLSDPEDGDSDCCSSPEDTYVTADEGYEADVENLEAKSKPGFNAGSATEVSSSPAHSGCGYSKTHFITHPDLCIIVVDILIHIHKKFYESSQTSVQKEELHIMTMCHCLQKLVVLCRENPANCVVLARNGIITQLLKGFAFCLVQRNSHITDLQQAVLEVVTLLARYCISSNELALYLSFFKAKDPPLDILLNPLIGLVKACQPQPMYILCFPVETSTSNKEEKNLQHTTVIQHPNHISGGLESAWSIASMSIPINTEVGWSMWQHGFSFCLWLRVEREPCVLGQAPSQVSDSIGSTTSAQYHDSMTKSSLLHMLSVGSPNLLVEFWTNAINDSIYIRLTRATAEGLELLAEDMVDNLFLSGQWHHLSVNIQDYVSKKKNVIELTFILDGYHEEKVSMNFSGILMRKTRQSSVLIGHTSNGQLASSWYLGNVMLFRCPVFTKERATYLVGLGPNHTCVTECEADKISPNFTNVFGPQTLLAGIDWETILETKKANLKELQDNLLLTYRAQAPNVANVYPQVVTNLGGVVGSLFPGQPGFRVVAVEQRASQQLPLALSPNILSAVNPQQYQGLIAAATILGGTPVFLFLFARVVELEAKQEEQALALFLLLKLVQSDAELFSQFVNQECHKLLLKVLSSPRCQPGLHVLKAVLDTCCDRPVLHYQPCQQTFSIIPNCEAVIINSFLLMTIVEAWRAWERADEDTLAFLFQALHVLLRDDHPFREFNAVQLNRVHMVEAVLLFCKERFLYEETLHVNSTVCYSLVELIRSLMGAPPEFSHIVAVTDFLVLLHPASTTYVTHVRPSYYFLLSTTAPSTKEKTAPVLMHTSADISWKFRPVSRLHAEEFKNVLTQPVDPQKLNKALTNLQIKQHFDDQEDAHLDSNRIEYLTVDSNAGDVKEMQTADMSDEMALFMAEIDQGHEKFTAETEDVKFDQCQKSENCQWLVVEGLLLLLRDTILVLPDNMANQVLNHVVKAEVLLVMANHSDPRVRTAVIKVLGAYLQRSTDEELNKFLKLRGFQQLASQLSLYPASADLVEACLTLITHCQAPLDEQAEAADGAVMQLNALPVILVLLEQSIHDSSLAHNLIVTIRDIVTKVLQYHPLRHLTDCGLLEAIEKTLVAVAHLPQESIDICGMSEQDILIGDLHVFFVTVITHILHTPGAHHMQFLYDIQLQLSYLERIERKSCGSWSRCVCATRDAQCVIFEGALDVLQDKLAMLHTPGPKMKSSLLASVLSTSYEEQVTEPLVKSQPFRSHSNFHNLKQPNVQKDVPRSELNDRFKSVITRAVEFLVNVEPGAGQSNIEVNFCRRLLVTLLQGLSSGLDRRGPPWVGAMFAVRDALRTQAANLVVWMLAPTQQYKLRIFVIHTLRAEPRCEDVLGVVLHTHVQVEQKFAAFVWELMQVAPNPTDVRACEELLQQTSTSFISSQWSDEVQSLVDDMARHTYMWEKHSEHAINRSIFKFEGLMKQVSENAMNVTRSVVEAQNSERKVFMEHIKMAYSENVQIRIKWYQIIQQLTHERAVWYFPELFPRSWQLDPTEGPARVRKRLKRCHLGIDPKYLLPERESLAGHKENPLAYLFEQDQQLSTSSVLIERLHTNEKIRHMCAARVITPASEVVGELLIGESCLYFVADTSRISEIDACSLDLTSTAWPFDMVKEIYNRRYQLQERALEIFLLSGKTYLIAFQSAKERDLFMSELSQCNLPNRQAGDNLTDAVHMWRDGLLTNWEYLTLLNKMAGRTFNDLMQYPVFPFVLADYVNMVLDLADPKTYRNFKRPMAVQDKRNEQHYINNYNYLKQELLEGLGRITLNQEPYHYGSHYSNSGTVLHFLVRLPPFTGIFLTYQDNNFDLPDRTFHSLHTTWRLTSADSTTDVKEIIPEFFFLPEFLSNNEGFNFGVRQNGQIVDGVDLPPWSNCDPRRFILIHRQALESDYVRENLPHWIDLVFGYKQTGKSAVDAINVFHPATYYGFNLDNIKDPLERTAWETMVKTYGQTPRQLFRSPHPMVVQSLSSRTASSSVRDVLSGVKGLLWGNYVGSPAEPDPCVVWKYQYRTPIAMLIPLLSNDVYGLGPFTSLLLSYNKEKGLSMVNTMSVLAAALVTWGHSDGVIRVKLKKEQPPWPILKSPALDPICLCSSAPDCPQLWLGHTSGKLQVFPYHLDAVRGTFDFPKEAVVLLGHTSTIICISICTAFSIVVTGSKDGTAIIWDLNDLIYVRSIENIGGSVNAVNVSETLGDIAVVVSCDLLLYTINGAFVSKVSAPTVISSVCFSTAPEGVSVNVVATGHIDGSVRLWSTWDLCLVGELRSTGILHPIISITYSHDAQHLYASTSDGTVMIWEGVSSKNSGKTPKFLSLAV